MQQGFTGKAGIKVSHGIGSGMFPRCWVQPRQQKSLAKFLTYFIRVPR